MAYTARVRNRPRNEIQYTVVPRSELIGLHHFVNEDEARRVREGQEERERLKQQSEERVRNWPNTIEAMRLKKEAERKQRLNEEEAVRKKKDEEDAHAQAEARREAIERANLILYEQDDRVKTFNSKMLLSHVLEERQKQLEMKEKLKEMDRHREREFSVTLQEQIRVAAEEEARQKEARRSAALKVRDMQQGQLAEAKQKHRRLRDDRRKEGEAIRYTAERAVLQELEEDKQKKVRAKDLADEYSKANLELEKTRAEQARLEEAENLKIQRFAQLKEEQMLERKRRADEKFKMDMERRQKMIERQSGHLQQIHSQQEERVLRQVQEEEVKHENKVADDRRRRIQVWNDIQESRAQQNEMKARKKRNDADEEAAFRDQWQTTASILVQEEANARMDARGKAKRLQEFQLLQHKERVKRKDMDKTEEKLEGQLMKKAVEEEEAMFKKYVDNVMTEYAAKGLDMGALRSIRKRGETM